MRPNANLLPDIPFPGIPSASKLDTAIKYTPGPIRPLANQTLGWLKTHLYSIEDPRDKQPPSIERDLSYGSSDDIPLLNSNMEKRHMSVAEVPLVAGADEYEDSRPMMLRRKMTGCVGRQRKTEKSDKLPSRPKETAGMVLENRRGYEVERTVGPILDNHTQSDHHQASKQHQPRWGRGNKREGQPRRLQRAYRSSQQLKEQEQAHGAAERESPQRIVDLKSDSHQYNYRPRVPSVMLHSNKRRIDTNSIPEMLDPRNQFGQDSARLTKASRLEADWEKVGSVFIIPEKVRISPDKQQNIERDVQEALASNMFKLWPAFEDGRQSWHDIGSGKDVEKRGTDNDMRASELYMREQEGDMARRKEELLKVWKKKDERRRDPGNWESESENQKLISLNWFKPTLQNNPLRAKTPTEAELEKEKPRKMTRHKDVGTRRKERKSILDEKRLAEGVRSSAPGSSRSSTSSDSGFLIQRED